ncbi:MAG: BMP family ABC transporter substrate-binding protein [Christensenellales bacterium]|jgi:basic membrane protein A
MKKSLAIFLAIVMVLGISLIGCGKNDGGAAVGRGETTSVKAGFIYIGPADDGGFSTSHDNGRKYLEEQLGIETVVKELVPESSEIENVIANMVDQGCNVIFGCSFGYMDYMEAMADEYPDVIFLHCSGYKSNGTNFVNYFGRIYQARFLSGLVAGMTTKSDKIGYVAAFAIPEVVRGLNAFALGVQAVNPNATVEVLWTSDWVDATKAKEAANALITDGCDVIAQHQDATSPQQAAEEAGVYSIGYHCDMSSSAPNANVASAVWNWGPYYVSVVQSIMDGTFAGENYWGPMSDGVVAVVLTDIAPKDAQAKVDEYKTKLLSEDWDVFTGPLTDNQGNTVAQKDEVLTDEQLLSMDWLNENVIGSVK